MPRSSPTGPKGAKIALVGEAPGKTEEQLGSVFVGSSGQELNRMLEDAGLERNSCYATNVFMDRPPGNKIEALCAKKAEVGGKSYLLPPLRQGKYFKPEHLWELDRLRGELEEVRPNLCIALGATAAWALLRNPKITSIRGTISESTLIPGLKVLPTYHPAAILRNWNWRAITLADLIKAKGEAEFPEIRRLRREIWIDVNLRDIELFFHTWLKNAKAIAFDIETRSGQITAISFAPDSRRVLCILFVDETRPELSYFSREDEIAAWNWVRKILALPCPKIAQNGTYDVQYLWRVMGIPTRNFTEDTMMIHHAVMPEMPKGLGFLGSIYCNEAEWKSMRTGKKDELLKRED